MTLPVKPISEIEEKAQVWADDRILILDADSEEARLASKDELKGDKWDTWEQWPQGIQWIQWDKWDKGDKGDKWDKGDTWDKWDKWDTWDTWPQGATWPTWNWISSITSSKVWKTTTVTITETSWNVDTFQVKDWEDGVWGDVFWPSSSTDWHLAVFDWATWKLLKDWGAMPTVPTKTSDLTNDSWFITWINSTDVTTALWYTPANSANLWTAASKNTWTSSGNVPVLDSNWKLNTSVVPAVAITDTFTINSTSELTSLSAAEKWDVAICPSELKTYILYADPYSVAANWKLLPTPTWDVTSVNGKTWVVTLDADDISDSSTTNKFVTQTDKDSWDSKQDELESWVNIRTINWTSILWSWNIDTPTGIPSQTWEAGKFLTTDWSSVSWGVPTGWIEVDSASPIQLTKIWAGTQAQYEALGSYDSTTVYLTI